MTAKLLVALQETLAAARTAPLANRVAVYNAATRMLLTELLYDLPQDPALAPQLLAAVRVFGNAYNPNHVAAPELDALEESMREDGITMCIVVSPDERDTAMHEVTDGFHRRLVATTRLTREYLPCAVLHGKTLASRMASTVRHNRARGKHQVELMGELVRSMINLGWTDDRIAKAIRMSEEEILRLKQTIGAAQILASPEYSRAWRGRDGDHGEDSAHKSGR